MFMVFPSSLHQSKSLEAVAPEQVEQSQPQRGTGTLPPTFNVVGFHRSSTFALKITHCCNSGSIYFTGNARLRCGTALRSGKAWMGKVEGWPMMVLCFSEISLGCVGVPIDYGIYPLQCCDPTKCSQVL